MLLIETMDFEYTQPQLVESEGQRWLEVEGRIQHADLQNANGRVYPRSLWERVLNDQNIIENINGGGMLGECDHPDDGKTSLNRVSHIMRKVWMTESGEVMGRMRILNNERGKNLREIFEAGGKVGISSRGSGSVKPQNGLQVVQEDFKLNTWDFVVTPSTPQAFPKVVNSGKATRVYKEDKQEESMDSVKKLTALKESVSELAEKATEVISTRAKKQVVSELIEAEVALNKLMNEDSSVATVAEEVRLKASATRKSLEEADEKKDDEDGEEKDSEKKSDDDSDDDEVVGDKEAPKKQPFMKGNVVGEASGVENNTEVETLLREMEKGMEQPVDEQITTLTTQRDGALRQARTIYRIAEADRQATGLVLNALRTRLKEILSAQQASPVVAESVSDNSAEIAQLKEENEQLRARNARLEGTLSKIQERVRGAESVSESADAPVLVKGKKAHVQEDELPVKGTEKTILVESKAPVKTPGAAMAARAIALMNKSKTSRIERGGQLFEDTNRNIR